MIYLCNDEDTHSLLYCQQLDKSYLAGCLAPGGMIRITKCRLNPSIIGNAVTYKQFLKLAEHLFEFVGDGDCIKEGPKYHAEDYKDMESGLIGKAVELWEDTYYRTINENDECILDNDLINKATQNAHHVVNEFLKFLKLKQV